MCTLYNKECKGDHVNKNESNEQIEAHEHEGGEEDFQAMQL